MKNVGVSEKLSSLDEDEEEEEMLRIGFST